MMSTCDNFCQWNSVDKKQNTKTVITIQQLSPTLSAQKLISLITNSVMQKWH